MFGKKTEIKLGTKVKDTVTGFTGIAISRTEWLNGCVRYGVQGPMKADGTVPEPEHVDVEQLEYVDGGVKTTAVPSGGDRPSAQRAPDPRR